MKGRLSISFNKSDTENFEKYCEAAIRNVGRGTKSATEKMCQDILKESQRQVPKDTNTLRDSGYYKVSRRTDTAASSWLYEGIIGYGGNGDPSNPKSKSVASDYMVKIHEDFSLTHTNGKAKFLEDPVREYSDGKFYDTFFKLIAGALSQWAR